MDLSLVPLINDYLPLLQAWDGDIEGMRMMGQLNRLPLSTYQKMIEDSGWNVVKGVRMDGELVGYITADVWIDDRKASISLYLAPNGRIPGVAHLSVLRMMEILFEHLSLHKVQFSIWDFNRRSLNNFKHLTPEAVLREDAYHHGRYWDKIIYSVLEQEWLSFKKELAALANRGIAITDKRRERRTTA